MQPILGKANADTATLAIDIISMFDADPGAGWSVLSNSSGTNPFYQQFVRPSSTSNLTSAGTDTHSIAYSDSSGAAIGTDVNVGLLGSGVAASSHTHGISASTNAVSNVPPYVNMVFAEKVSFTMAHYEWYAEAASQDVTDPWPAGSVNIGIDKQVSAIPAPYLPPDPGTQLRLRVQILVSGQPLTASSTSFKLQYARTSASDCISGNWYDFGANGDSGSVEWDYGTNGVGDSTALTTSRLSPASNVLEVFSKSAAGGTTPNGATSGQTIEYDWLVKNNAATSATVYHIRPIESSGTFLGQYNGSNPLTSKCPAVVTKPSADQQLRHGNFFLTNAGSGINATSEQGFSWAD